MSNTKRLQTDTIKLAEAQHYFLRTRYGHKRDVSATRLVKKAMLEIVAMQAQKELDETGYDAPQEQGEATGSALASAFEQAISQHILQLQAGILTAFAEATEGKEGRTNNDS